MNNTARIAENGKPRIVIIGGGFAGVRLAKALRGADAQVVLIDKSNHFTFQPLLYQVASASLEAETIVQPFRKYFKGQANFYFRLGEVKFVDTEHKRIETSIGEVTYDYLVIATGATTNFYGNREIERNAVTLKSIEDALYLRNKILKNFEDALLMEDVEQMNSLMDYVIVGGGPTGVELAGSLCELKRHVFPTDYRELNLFDMDIHLIQSGPRLLNGMSEEASRKAEKYLTELGVKIWLERRVTSYDGYTVTMNTGETLITKTLVWAAGVNGVPLPGLRPESIVKGERLEVDAYNRVTGYENVFAIGDAAAMITDKNPQGHPMMSPPAMQQGKQLAKNLMRLMQHKPLHLFRYIDKGSMAIVGRNRAVLDTKFIKTQGFVAWMIWMTIHWFYLAGLRNKFKALSNWVWSYFSQDKGIRLIIGHKEDVPVSEAKKEPVA